MLVAPYGLPLMRFRCRYYIRPFHGLQALKPYFPKIFYRHAAPSIGRRGAFGGTYARFINMFFQRLKNPAKVLLKRNNTPNGLIVHVLQLNNTRRYFKTTPSTHCAS